MGGKISQDSWNELNVSIAMRDNELHIVQERITDPNNSVPLYEIKKESTGLSNDVQVAYNNFGRGRNKPTIICNDQIAILNQLISPATFSDKDKESQKTIPNISNKFQKILGETLFLDPVPAKMRNSSAIDKEIKIDGSNLAGVLYHICKDAKLKKQLLEFVRSLPEQNITNIVCKKEHRGNVYFELKESFGNVKENWTAELLSDGTLRVLAIATALLSVPEGSAVVIEEIDNGIHPSRAKQLMETITKYAKKRNLRLLLSTHNPALMDALPDEALQDVVFCYRDKVGGDSRLVRLSDLPNYPELLVQGTLGDLVTQGILDKFVKSPTTPEQRKQQALEWLNSLGDTDNE